MEKKLILFLCFFVSIQNSFTKETKPKFGKISMEEMQMTSYQEDTAADAVILFQTGETEVQFSENNGFQLVHEFYRRVKIFNKNAFDYFGNYILPLYHSIDGRSKEELYDLKAVTYNLENGSIVKTEIKKDAIVLENVSPILDVKKFSIPNLKEGSIVEIKYKITSDYLYHLQEWYFQYPYPVAYNEYVVKIPEYFQYRSIPFGYEPVSYELTKENGSISFVNQRDKKYTTIDFFTYVHKWTAKNMPAFKNEPYITSIDNYRNRVEFDLESVYFPWSVREDYSRTWESINKMLMNDEDFGMRLKSTGFLKTYLDMIIKPEYNDEQKIAAIHEYIRKNIKWNQLNRYHSSKGFKKVLEEKTGNSADINLLLVAMLREAGFDANPVVISTRNNGFIHPYIPSTARFNYVIAQVKTSGKTYLLDATESNCPYYLLPTRCLNGQGRLMNENYTQWVNLNPNQEYDENSYYTIDIQEDGTLKGKYSFIKKKYAALSLRNQIQQQRSLDDYILSVEKKYPGLDISSYSFSALDSVDLPVSGEFEVEIKNSADVFGNQIVFAPLLFEAMKKNIFKIEDRKYPVEYEYPISTTCRFLYTIPDGYTVEAIPTSASFSLPDNSATFNYKVTVDGNKISVIYKLKINKITFMPTEYSFLKKFYETIVAKHNENIVLKKNN